MITVTIYEEGITCIKHEFNKGNMTILRKGLICTSRRFLDRPNKLNLFLHVTLYMLFASDNKLQLHLSNASAVAFSAALSVLSLNVSIGAHVIFDQIDKHTIRQPASSDAL